jgi:hypothetical protein
VATKTRRAPERAPSNGKPTLPPMTVARFGACLTLMEHLVSEKADLFLAAAQDYREKHRTHSSRPLTAQEATSFAAVMAQGIESVDTVAAAEQLQASTLRATDEPAPQEFLIAAGVATAPAFFDAALQLTALVELDADAFETAYEDGTLDLAVVEKKRELQALDMRTHGRVRAMAALDHFTQAGGGSPGEALGLLTRLVGQAFSTAMQTLGPLLQSTSESLTGSPDQPAIGGSDERSSTTSPGATP